MKNQTQICHDIISTVARLFGLKADTVTGPGRTRRIVDARFIAMWLCKLHTNLPDQVVAGMFGNHRSMVRHVNLKVQDWTQTDPVFREMFDMAAEAIGAQETIPVRTAGEEPEVEVPVRNGQVRVNADLPSGWKFTEMLEEDRQAEQEAPTLPAGVAQFEAGNASEGKDTGTT